MEINKKSSSFFQMPLHYPRFTKKDYQTMPEWQLDRLLAEYGLPIDGDSDFKREFAIGAFLWPEPDHNSGNSPETRNSSPTNCNGYDHDSSLGFCKKFKIVEFFSRFKGHA